jgi:mono/diheme cytochrome c family protein
MWTRSNALTLIPVSKIRSVVKPTAIAAVLIASAAVPVLRAQSDSELPAGPMQAKATTACAECHEARIIVQQRLSKAAWTKEVDKMTKWGALVDPQDRDALIDYLSTNFGVDKPAYVADRTRSTAKKEKK